MIEGGLEGYLKLMINDICMNPITNFDNILNLYEFAGSLIEHYGMNAFESIKLLLFHDIDTFNISFMLMQFVKMIVLKRDQTIIDLGGQKNLKSGQVFQKNNQRQSSTDVIS
jgi:hypothetical protein